MNPRRLEAEALRDAVMAVSGTLDLSPAEKSIVSKVGNGDIGRTLKTGSFVVDHTKRSVYLPIVRGVVPEMLQNFRLPRTQHQLQALVTSRPYRRRRCT